MFQNSTSIQSGIFPKQYDDDEQFVDESSSQDFFHSSQRKLSDDPADFAPITFDSELNCNSCIVTVDDLFCDKDTFSPCLETQAVITSQPVYASSRGGRVNSKHGKATPIVDHSELSNRKRVRRTARRRRRLSSNSLTPPPPLLLFPSISPTSQSFHADSLPTAMQCHRTLSSSRGRPIKLRKDENNATTLMNDNSLSQQEPLKEEEEHHSSTVLCASNEVYAVSQDMCVSCGTIGLDKEGRLISCSQCGQSYHPYCVGFTKTLSKVVFDKGWRCLDCTACECCGKTTDEGKLLLCDDCDISYHTYCLSPPLDHVPKGNWKCQWCVHCVKCGSTSPGQDCQWENNYTECGQCFSLSTCPLCLRKYRSDELIIQCGKCNRWCHSMCANIFTEEMAERKCQEKSFLCLLCQPDQSTLILMRYSSTNSLLDQQITPNKSVKFDEGVYLTENGMAHLKAIRPKVVTQAARRAKQPVQKNQQIYKRSNSIGINDEERSDEEKTPLNNEPATKKPAIRKYTGIGGFAVKIRGNRRRQDLLHMDSEILRTKNKRLRKTILEEHMPPEMQEAFFGMDLANQNRVRNPLDDECVTTDPSATNLRSFHGEYSIQLDPDTIKYLTTKRKAPVSVPNEDEHDMQPIFGNEEFKDLVACMLNPAPNPPSHSSGDIWEFIDFVDQPNPSDTSSMMDWSTTSIYHPSNNPNQIIRNMARELEESTVGPSPNSFLSQSNKSLLRHDTISWLPTPPHGNQSPMINGNYPCLDNRTMSTDYHRSQSSSKRNTTSFPVDESYHMFQLYQQQMQQTDHLQKSAAQHNFDESTRSKDHFPKSASGHYPMNMNHVHPSAAPYTQHSLPPLDLNCSSQSSLPFDQDSPTLFVTRSNSCQSKTPPSAAAVYHNTHEFLPSYQCPPPMRSTSCFAMLPLNNGHQIEPSLSENNLSINGKKSTTRNDVLLNVPLEVLDKIDEVISDVISGQGDIPVEPESARQRSHSRLTYADQHHVICDSSYIPLNQEPFNWPSTQQSDGFAPSSSHQSERIVVAELISSILSNGAPSAM